MSYGTKNVVNEERKSLGLGYGILKVSIIDFNLKTAVSGKKMLEFIVEDDTPVDEDGYTYTGLIRGDFKAKNKSTRIAGSIYIDIDTDTTKTETIVKSLASLADKTGCREVLDTVEGDNFEDYLKKAVKVICGKEAWFVVKAEEYINKTSGKVGINRNFKSWGQDSPYIIFPVEGTVVTKDKDVHTLTSKEGKIITWDRNNAYDYKPVVTPDKEVANPLDIPGMNATNEIPF